MQTMAFVSELIGTQPILALFLAIGLGYAVGQISILGFSLGIGAVLFVGLFLGAIAPSEHRWADRADRLDHVPLWHRHPVRSAVLRGADRAGPDIHPARAGGGRRWAGGGAVPWLDLRRQARPYAGDFCGIHDQHGDAAGRARRHEEQRALDWLFRRLSLRRDRPDPLLLLPDAEGEADLPAQARTLPYGRGYH